MREQLAEQESQKSKIVSEEAIKRQEIVNRLQQTIQHRDHLQNLLQQSQKARSEFDSRLGAMQSTNESLKSSNAALQAEVGRLETKLREMVQAKQAAEHEVNRMRADHDRMQQIIDRLKQEEVARAKALERAIVGYVRTVEKSSIDSLNAI